MTQTCPLKCCEMLFVNISVVFVKSRCSSKQAPGWSVWETCLETAIIPIGVASGSETAHFILYSYIVAMGHGVFACTTQVV